MTSALFRGYRGGGFVHDYYFLLASARSSVYPATENHYIGFRVAGPVPEPASIALLSVAALALLLQPRRRNDTA